MSEQEGSELQVGEKQKSEQQQTVQGAEPFNLGKFMNSTAPVTVLFTNGIFLIVLGIIITLIFTVASDPSDSQVRPINALVSLLGALCGWIAGTGLAPYTAAEGQRFKEISVAASAFLSGYVVSKLDHLLDAALALHPDQHPVAWERAGLFLAAFLATVITVFINRFYSPTVAPSQATGGTAGQK